MSDEGDKNVLHAQFGTGSPCWRLSGDRDVLELMSVTGHVPANVAVPLTPKQAARIRGLSGVTAHLVLSVRLLGESLRLHLVGKKLKGTLWAGTASAEKDTESVARDLVHGLTFAEQLVSEVNSVIVVVDRNGDILRFNRAAEDLTGLKEEDVIGQNVAAILSRPDVRYASTGNERPPSLREPYDVEQIVKTGHGERLILFRNKLIESEDDTGDQFLIWSGIDVTEERRAQQRLLELANTDSLTGLPNRTAIQDGISACISRAAQEESIGILFIDLDNFKKVNDYYGHVFGDQLIKDFSAVVSTCLNRGDTLARVSGDEFVVLMTRATTNTLEATAQRILERMRVPFRVGLVEVYSSCSIGIALSPQHGENVESLIRSADMAMYVAKDEGKHRYRVFSPEMDRKVAEYVWLDRNLRHGLAAGELTLHYQPKLLLATGAVQSVEALVRWVSPQRGLVMPGEFIRYAEESGLIEPLGRWVMQTAARQAAQWKAQGIDLRIAINVSARQFGDATVVRYFREALESAGLEPCLLDIELTESCLIEDEATAIELITQFRGLGAQVHLDDFGTGYSSLARLGRIPLDMIKLDPIFVRSINGDMRARALMRSMVAVAQELSLQVVVEGVETEAEENFMKALGVDYVQGYRYGRPMPVVEFERWLANRQNLRLIA